MSNASIFAMLCSRRNAQWDLQMIKVEGKKCQFRAISQIGRSPKRPRSDVRTTLGNKEGEKRTLLFSFPVVNNPAENMKLCLEKMAKELVDSVPDNTFCTVNFHHPILTQSNTEVRYDTQFQLELIYFVPPQGAGKKRLEDGVYLVGSDSYCLIKSLLIGKAAVDRDNENVENANATQGSRQYRDAYSHLVATTRQTLMNRCFALLRRAQLPSDKAAYSIMDLETIYDNCSEFARYQVIVYKPEGNSIVIIARNGPRDSRNKIRLLLKDNHFAPLVELS